MRLTGVVVSPELPAAYGFTARVGERVRLGLGLYCRYRVAGHPVGEVRTGTVVPAVEEVVFGGWILRSEQIPFHVTEAPPGADPGREAGSDLAEPVPPPGSTVFVRGVFHVVHGYEIGAVSDGWDVDLRRWWLVERIVRTTASGAVAGDVAAIGCTGEMSGHRIDLLSSPEA